MLAELVAPFLLPLLRLLGVGVLRPFPSTFSVFREFGKGATPLSIPTNSFVLVSSNLIIIKTMFSIGNMELTIRCLTRTVLWRCWCRIWNAEIVPWNDADISIVQERRRLTRSRCCRFSSGRPFGWCSGTGFAWRFRLFRGHGINWLRLNFRIQSRQYQGDFVSNIRHKENDRSGRKQMFVLFCSNI